MGKFATFMQKIKLSIMTEEEKKTDVDLEKVKEIVKNGKFLNLRSELEKAGFKKVDFNYAGGAHWDFKGKAGKTIVIINKSNVDVSPNDIVVGNFVIGYL